MSKDDPKGKTKPLADRYGIREWYGHDVRNLNLETRIRFAGLSPEARSEPCPFLGSSFANVPCMKKGGVCSIVRYTETTDGTQMSGVTSTICPDRFWEDKTIIGAVAEKLLGSKKFYVLREIDFLKSIGQSSSVMNELRIGEAPEFPAIEEDGEEVASGKAVGKIDIILVDAKDKKKWCAVEMQAVYFSGPNMETHRQQFVEHAQSLPWPDRVRRPDYRSSSSKRLLPQLQVKVPDLRRWGNKMAVIIDRSFFQSMAPMKDKMNVSNADIIWFVVDYDNANKIVVKKIVNTTLEDAVIGLTAAEPVGQEAFQNSLSKAIDAFDKSQTGNIRDFDRFPEGTYDYKKFRKSRTILVER